MRFVDDASQQYTEWAKRKPADPLRMTGRSYRLGNYLADHTINPSITATSVVAISNVRRLKRQAIQGTDAIAETIVTRNQYGTLTTTRPRSRLVKTTRTT